MACPELILFGLYVHFVTEGTTSINPYWAVRTTYRCTTRNTTEATLLSVGNECSDWLQDGIARV
ncbi:hypothetical protein PR002_g30861 [Phytophthora rubi]|uniref:Aquaporin n=1 Tax=Phytophthora rubi TaxID=129364 RepID=A0A6A3GHZ6_9STRA|nr:hypothetical protein PR002_g30861 [Phytophthora rubi]